LNGCSTTARAVGRGYAVRIPQGVENETFNYSHFGSGGGDTALLDMGLLPCIAYHNYTTKFSLSKYSLFLALTK